MCQQPLPPAEEQHASAAEDGDDGEDVEGGLVCRRLHHPQRLEIKQQQDDDWNCERGFIVSRVVTYDSSINV